jgi:hypothetical protein
MPVGFRISGTLESGVHLRMFDPKDEATVTIEELVVSETTGSEDWSVPDRSEERTLKVATGRTVWRLVGRANVPEIVYGNAPDGLGATEGPVPLAPGKTYDVFAGGTIGLLWRRDARGGCRFSVTAAGRVDAPPGC